MATTYLWDDSHYGAPPTSRDGIDGYTHKLTDGLRYYEDPEFKAALTAARTLGYPILGAYHVLHGGKSVTGQADWMIQRLDGLTPWWRSHPYFVLQIDAEPFDYLVRPSVAECNAFGAALAARSGLPASSILGYLAAWSYGAQVKNLTFPFWHANYGSNPALPYRQAYPGNDSPRWVGGGRRADLLQYGSRTIIAGQATSDASAYAGTLDQLKAFLRPGPTRPTIPKEDTVDRLIHFGGAYWLVRDGKRHRIPDGDTYDRAKTAYPGWPGVDKNGYATPDLAEQGWPAEDIDLIFGPEAGPDTPTTPGGGPMSVQVTGALQLTPKPAA